MGKSKRTANIELLRLMAMAMVVSLHFLAKGKVLPSLTMALPGYGYAAWLLENFSISAVNVFVLISGYYLAEAGFRIERILSLWFQVVFYTLLVPVCLLITGVISASDISFYKILQDIFPINMLHYWFVSAYLLMLFYTPLLRVAVKHMTKKQLRSAILLLVFVEAGIKTLLPVRLELDNLGYDALWFMVLWLIAAYIRKYGIPFFKSVGKAFFSFVLLTLASFLLTLGIHFFYLKTGKLEIMLESVYGYNHILTLFAAISLFYTFLLWKGPKSSFLNGLGKLGTYSFGVYLLHEQIEIRYLWPTWLGAERVDSLWSLLLQWLMAIVIVMAAGLFVDFLRSLLFQGLGKILPGEGLKKTFAKINGSVNGEEPVEEK